MHRTTLIFAGIILALYVVGLLKQIYDNRKNYEGKIIRVGELRAQQIDDIELPVGDWRWSSKSKRTLVQFRYWCPCGTPLTDGPRGGLAVNAVCKNCRINYGELKGFWGDQEPFEPLPKL